MGEIGFSVGERAENRKKIKERKRKRRVGWWARVTRRGNREVGGEGLVSYINGTFGDAVECSEQPIGTSALPVWRSGPLTHFFFLPFHSALVSLHPVGYGLAADGRMQERVVDGDADDCAAYAGIRRTDHTVPILSVQIVVSYNLLQHY